MTIFAIECRTLETEACGAGPWNRDGLIDPTFSMGGPSAGDIIQGPTHSLYEFQDRAEAERVAAQLPGVGDEWAEREYRVREILQ
jgi:hypothetical protein